MLRKFDSPVYNALTRVCDIVILNALWTICSIPLITMGAATSALYYSMLKICRETDSSMTGMFFHSFRQNLRQGCGLTILFGASGLLLYVDIQLCQLINGMPGKALLALMIALLIVWGMIFSYTFPVLAQFDNTIAGILKNAFFMSIDHMGKTIIILLVNAIIPVMFFVVPQLFFVSIPIWLLGGIAVITFINTKLLTKIFDRYIENN